MERMIRYLIIWTCSLLLFLPLACYGKSDKGKTGEPSRGKKPEMPPPGEKKKSDTALYFNAGLSDNGGQIEVGAEIETKKVYNDETWTLRPMIRVPLTNKDESSVRLDRFTTDWRLIMETEYSYKVIGNRGHVKTHAFSGQFEYGVNQYKYYPLGTKESEKKTLKSSYSVELKYVGFSAPETSQYSPQVRLRYAHNRQAANEVGIVNPPNVSGLVTTSSMRLEGPSVVPLFSPAVAMPIYWGKVFSFAPAVFYNFVGKRDTNSPFNDLQRLQFETWAFCRLKKEIAKQPIKFGLAPFVSLRTKGSDNFRRSEWGVMLTVKTGGEASLMHFF